MELAGTLATGARIWRRRGEDAKAVRTYEQAIDVLKALASPDAPIYWYRLLGYVHSSAGRALMDLGRREEAAVQFGAAVDVLQQLARSRPQFEDKVAEYQALLDEARGKAR